MEKKGKHAVFNLFFRRNYHVYLPLSAAVAAGVHLLFCRGERLRGEAVPDIAERAGFCLRLWGDFCGAWRLCRDGREFPDPV